MLQKACWLALRALVVVVHLHQFVEPGGPGFLVELDKGLLQERPICLANRIPNYLFQALPPFLLLSMLWATAPLRLFLSNLRDILFV